MITTQKIDSNHHIKIILKFLIILNIVYNISINTSNNAKEWDYYYKYMHYNQNYKTAGVAGIIWTVIEFDMI